MARPKGSADRPGTGRSTGRKPTFGHRKAIQEYRAGAEFTGQLAIAKEQEIRERWASDGVMEIMTDNTVRLQVCLELYETCVLAKVKAGDEKTLPRALKDYAALVSKANTELRAIHELARAKDGGSVIDAAMIAAREATNGDG